MSEPASQPSELGDQAKQILGAAEADVAAAAASAARLVQRAGAILEEELSVGIAAMDRLESRFVDVEAIRDPETHELLNRFRTDAHQIVDLLIDVVGTSFDALGRVADQGISIGLPIDKLMARAARNGSPNPVNGGSTGTVSVLDAVETVARGGDATLSMAVTNSSDSMTEPFSLVASDLISDAGQRIAATHVSFEPASVVLAAKASERVTIKVHVPDGIDPGRYAGLVQATNLEHVRAVLTITVT
ncbi:hypothetical protein [Desertimonas flava]|uniref:COG1470 family protein n=1 Tax=Desertimonas flava TaxID=2064846 RepID=UPI000E35230E|nr:hypothetical protein [Desertimonas flava]